MGRTDHRVAVVGGGGVGAAAAWALARAGVDVVLIERYRHAHALGASHGATRNFNPGYTRPEYLALLRAALPLWREIEAESGAHLLDQVGVVNRGPRPDVADLLEALPTIGLRAELLDAREASRRWPQLRFAGPAVHLPDGGRLYAERSVDALYRVAEARGARILEGTRVTSLQANDDGVVIDTDGGPITARTAVVAAGAWSSRLLDGVVDLPPLTVTQEQPAHFALAAPLADLPAFNHHPEADSAWWPSAVYGGWTPGVGIKAGWHGVGPITDPDARTLRSEPAQLLALRRYVAEWIPGADPDRFEEISCTYTTTPTADFAIGAVGPITVAAGFSGHGFKFLPALGELLARLASTPGARSPFRLA